MKMNDLVKEAYEIAKSKGWHETERSPLEAHALIHSEISEATEEVRKNKPFIYEMTPDPNGNLKDISAGYSHGFKPEGEAIELADAVIRIADYFGERGWDLEEAIKLKMEYNKGRSYRHGNKKY